MLAELSAYTQLRAGASRKVRLSMAHNDRVALQQVVTRLSRGTKRSSCVAACRSERRHHRQSCARSTIVPSATRTTRSRSSATRTATSPRCRTASTCRPTSPVHLLAEKPQVIAERRHAADPEPLALGGGNLVPDALGGNRRSEGGRRWPPWAALAEDNVNHAARDRSARRDLAAPGSSNAFGNARNLGCRHCPRDAVGSMN
jgi:hypothetical protein